MGNVQYAIHAPSTKSAMAEAMNGSA